HSRQARAHRRSRRRRRGPDAAAPARSGRGDEIAPHFARSDVVTVTWTRISSSLGVIGVSTGTGSKAPRASAPPAAPRPAIDLTGGGPGDGRETCTGPC